MRGHDLSIFADLRPVIYKAEALLLERSILESSGPRFRITHRFGICGSQCGPGEEIFAIFLIYREREIIVSLPLALRLLFDYLGRHRYVGQSASQIAAGMRTSSSYRNHARNSGELSRHKISCSTVKEYVLRTRHALETAIRQTPISLEPNQILVSELTEGNEVQYRLRATVQWLHSDGLPARR